MSSGQPDYAGTVLGPRVVPATYERRTIVLNDSEIVAGAPPSNRSAIDYGKFFPRGMRGAIEEIRLYCLGDGADSVSVSISPQPGLGPTYTTAIVPAAAWGWRDVAFNVMWNYDSMYVWVSACEANVDWGYDDERPRDGHHTADGGATFTDLDERPYIRVVMTGETAGDVPISGIVNNIRIPATSSSSYSDWNTILDGVPEDIITITGAGTVNAVMMGVQADTESEYTQFRIYTDGVMVYDRVFYTCGIGVHPVPHLHGRRHGL